MTVLRLLRLASDLPSCGYRVFARARGMIVREHLYVHRRASAAPLLCMRSRVGPFRRFLETEGPRLCPRRLVIPFAQVSRQSTRSQLLLSCKPYICDYLRV